jgi:hypothetical protein
MRVAAQIALIAGAVGSLVFMLSVGSRAPVFLILMFAVWVLSPFVALLVLSARSWVSPSVMLLVPLVSLLIYGLVALRLSLPKPAAPFLLVPLGSWILIGIMMRAGRRVRRV